MPGTNTLASNSQGALPSIVDVTLGLKSIISALFLPLITGNTVPYNFLSYELTVTKSPGSASSITKLL